jgi:hypothetical protein
MTAKKTPRPNNHTERAFRDAMRDILAAEGWFELDVDPAPARTPGGGQSALAARAGWRWPLSQPASA